MIHCLVLTAIAMSSAVASTHSAQWQTDYGKALAETRADDRPLLVVLDVPSDPKAAAQDKQLKTEKLTSYRLCHIDASTEYGQKVAKVFKAEKFPFTAIIDKTGSIVLHKQQGQLTDAQWNETLSTYQSGERTALQDTSAHREYTSAYRGAYRGQVIESGSMFSDPAARSTITNPSYCPSCQQNSQQSF